MELTAAREAELEAVNASVNRRIREKSDLQTSGNADDWQLPSSQGDCEDFAILKKSELLKRGWPASVLLLTVARLGDGGHTVLTVRTSKGDKVLDNRTNAIRNWSNTPYRYFARQSQFAAGKWVHIEQPKSDCFVLRTGDGLKFIWDACQAGKGSGSRRWPSARRRLKDHSTSSGLAACNSDLPAVWQRPINPAGHPQL
jgi:hypothetical protein